MCEDFLIHLETGKNPRKRGRRKGTIIMTPSVSAITTSVSNTLLSTPPAEPVVIVQEKIELSDTATMNDSGNNNIDTNVCDIKKEIVSDNESSVVPSSAPVEEFVNGVKIEIKEEVNRKSSDSESEEEAKPPMTLRVRKPKLGPKPRVRKRRIVTPKKKPPIVNGNHNICIYNFFLGCRNF